MEKPPDTMVTACHPSGMVFMFMIAGLTRAQRSNAIMCRVRTGVESFGWVESENLVMG